jgi:ABC-type branched-subunit amino acid transport system substrate-binding protein
MAEEVHSGVATLVSYDPEAGNYEEAATETMEEEPTEVGVVGRPDEALEYVTAVAEQGYAGPLVFSDHLMTADFASAVSDAAESGFAVAPNPESSPGAGSLDGRASGDANEFTANAYDATVMVALALHQGGEAKGYEVALNVADISHPTQDTEMEEVEAVPGQNGLQEAKTAINDQKTVNYQGASGRVDLARDHDPLDRVGVYELGDGSFSHIKNIEGDAFEQSIGAPPTG